MRHAIRALIPLVGLGLGLGGCAGSEAQRTEASRDLSSPDGVAAEINGANLEKVKSVWYRLGVSRPGVQPQAFKTLGRPANYAQGPFTAEVFRMDLDGSATGVESGMDAIVRVADPAAWDWQLLAFLDSPTGWRFAGAIDLPEHRVGAPAPRTRTLGPAQSWLTVDTYKQSSKVATERETAWYQVRDGRLVEVLRTPAEGHRMGLTASFDVAYRAEVLDLFLTPENHVAVTVNIEAVYSNARREAFPKLAELFRRTGVAKFVQRTEGGAFTLDTRSDWSKEELAGLLTESADQFVHNNRVQLVELAHSSDPAKKQWVSRLRQDCASPEIRQELTALVSVEGDG